MEMSVHRGTCHGVCLHSQTDSSSYCPTCCGFLGSGHIISPTHKCKKSYCACPCQGRGVHVWLFIKITRRFCWETALIGHCLVNQRKWRVSNDTLLCWMCCRTTNCQLIKSQVSRLGTPPHCRKDNFHYVLIAPCSGTRPNDSDMWGRLTFWVTLPYKMYEVISRNLSLSRVSITQQTWVVYAFTGTHTSWQSQHAVM